ncbi:hypothetical protein T12_12495 [Trichinella patagoniensis]|uniref:Secreted protein n=1 Tax=Trichinella patagoniensis TaxID=990121 RepID=A0A0V1AG07_9BILA|nr:hypothetical protein T12_12495 [Trichinella patagoniensis]
MKKEFLVPLTMLRLLIVGQVSTKSVFWPINTHNTICLFEDACERKKRNNLARYQLLNAHHEHSHF